LFPRWYAKAATSGLKKPKSKVSSIKTKTVKKVTTTTKKPISARKSEFELASSESVTRPVEPTTQATKKATSAAKKPNQIEQEGVKKVQQQPASSGSRRRFFEVDDDDIEDDSDYVEEQPPAPIQSQLPTRGVVTFTERVLDKIVNIVKAEAGEDIMVIDLSKKTNWIPFMVITSAMSSRHCVAIAENVKKQLKLSGLVKNARIERNEGDEWVIVNAGTVIVEIMTPEQRADIDLERLWVLKKTIQDTMQFAEDESRFMYDEEDGMWGDYDDLEGEDDDDDDIPLPPVSKKFQDKKPKSQKPKSQKPRKSKQ
jgi:ribosome-associated protein